MKKAKAILTLSFVVIFTMAGVAVADWDPADGHKMHFPQLPDPIGWDVNATTPLVVADDWQCSETGYVKDIHFWGSWKDISLPPDGHGDPGTIIGFILSIYTNDPGPPSKPLELLWQRTITDFTVAPVLLGDQGWYDPYIPEVIRPDHQEYYQYNIFLEEADWFEQIQGEIYWLSISAQVQGTFPQPLWGWKTSTEHFMDDSVWSSYEFMQPIPWYELFNPLPPNESLDQAFVINGEPEEGACCYPDPTGFGTLCIETTQANCEDPTSYDGIYQGDGTVCLGIEACCLQDGSCIDVDSICCDDLGGTPQGAGTACTTPEGCCLADGTCQDLDPLCCDDQGGTPQGAGTACTATEACCFSDGSCQDLDPLCCDDEGGSPSPTGALACLGDGNQNGTDDACEEEAPPELKWLQPPDLSDHGMDVSDFAVDPYPPYVLADDFLCEMTGPLTRVHIWGSWFHDNLPYQDPMSVTFTLSIHDDIPADQSPYGYSIPGETLWTCQPPFVLGEVIPGLLEGWLEPPDYYDLPGADTICFEYVFDLTDCPPFVQQGTEQDPVIYWLDVQAEPIDLENDAFFGWKTSIEHWNDDAVWINGIEPIGPPPQPWQELRYPPGHPLYPLSIDLAFALYGYESAEDRDQDGVLDPNDNCPDYPNGPLLGTCTETTFYNFIVSTGQYCTADGDCDPGEYCEKWQADNYPPGGNGIGDACDCEGDFDCSGGVDAGDVGPFLADWNHRTIYSNPCTNGDQCDGDFNCNRGVGADDVGKFLEDWNHRTIYVLPCPPCAGGTYHPWCAYP